MSHPYSIVWTAGLLAALLLPSTADATSQWSRKYGVACTTCHSPAFARLNYNGEKFQRNGYQDIGTEDGDETKQKIGDRLFIDELQNFLGARLNVTPLRIVTDDLQTGPSSYGTRVDIGNPNWLQVFTAGSVYKNVSIFIETEITQSGGGAHNNWFRFGFHNLLGTPLLNAWAGTIDPLELHATSGRLPMIPPVKQDVFLVKSSGGATGANESIDIRSARRGLALYGSSGPFVYEIGVDNGPNEKDTNTHKNTFATLRLEATNGALEGSSISMFGYQGRDSKIITPGFTDQYENDFWRVSPAANLRMGGFDMLAGYVYGEDDNWALAAPGAEVKNKFSGLMFQAGHPLTERFHLALQYDRISSSDALALEVNKVALALSYAPRENWRIMLVPRIDLLEEVPTTHPRKNHELVLNIRSMI